jgi:hypothetical protein
LNLFADIRITREEGDPPFVLGMIAFVRWAIRRPSAAEALLVAVESAYKEGKHDLHGSDDAMREGYTEAYADLVATPGAGDGVSFLGMLNNVSLRLDKAGELAAVAKDGAVPVFHLRSSRSAESAGARRARHPREGRRRT